MLFNLYTGGNMLVDYSAGKGAELRSSWENCTLTFLTGLHICQKNQCS
jgi:hypothetical protein